MAGLACLFAGTAPASAALVAHYTLDGNVNDVTGNGNDGSTVGTVAFSTDAAPVPGGSTHSLQFNSNGTADDGFVDLPEGTGPDNPDTDSDLFLNGSYTLAAWVKIDARSGVGLSGAATILGNAQDASPFAHNYLLRVFYDGHPNANQVGFIARDSSGDAVALTDPIVPALDQWIHYAATFDATDGQATLYRNGTAVATGTLANFDGFDPSGQTATLGDPSPWGAGATDDNFNGKLDDVRLYNEALSSTEIRTLVPEPGTLILLGLGGLAMLTRRRTPGHPRSPLRTPAPPARILSTPRPRSSEDRATVS